MGHHPNARPRGQALVEFALVIPILLSISGVTLDLARAYQAWNTLESATRDAAEYVATNDSTSTAAAADAARIVCSETTAVPGYVASSTDPAGCTNPTVTLNSFALSATAAGATTRNPIGSVSVTVRLPFHTLFPYPLFTDNGTMSLGATRTFSIVQGRDE